MIEQSKVMQVKKLVIRGLLAKEDVIDERLLGYDEVLFSSQTFTAEQLAQLKYLVEEKGLRYTSTYRNELKIDNMECRLKIEGDFKFTQNYNYAKRLDLYFHTSSLPFDVESISRATPNIEYFGLVWFCSQNIECNIHWTNIKKFELTICESSYGRDFSIVNNIMYNNPNLKELYINWRIEADDNLDYYYIAANNINVMGNESLKKIISKLQQEYRYKYIKVATPC
jgi:hypothetical protein